MRQTFTKARLLQAVLLLFISFFVFSASHQVVEAAELTNVTSAQQCSAAGGSWTTETGGGQPRSVCRCPGGNVVVDGRCADPSTVTEGPGTEGADTTDAGGDLEFGEDGSKIFDFIQTGITLMTALAGIAITGAVIFAGIQYSTAGGNPQAAAQAKSRITNAMIALFCLIFLFAFFQWLVPGGIFN